MIHEFFRSPDPSAATTRTTMEQVLEYARLLDKGDVFSERELEVLDFFLVDRCARFIAREDDILSVAELQRLIRYFTERARNLSNLPSTYLARWWGLHDVLEASRLTKVYRRTMFDTQNYTELLPLSVEVLHIISANREGVKFPTLISELPDRKESEILHHLDLLEGRGLIKVNYDLYWIK